MELSQLALFLKESRLKGYAGGGEFVRLGSGFKGFACGGPKGLLYEDRYIALSVPESFAGEELVHLNVKPLWHMVYSGGMIMPYAYDKSFVKKIMQFLKGVLCDELRRGRDPRKEFWPRGPMGTYKDDCIAGEPVFSYRCYMEGHDICRFRGLEVITLETSKDFYPQARTDVFVHTFCGGIIGKQLIREA